MAENPDYLHRAFEAIGFRAWDEEMLSICRELYSVAGQTDFQCAELVKRQRLDE